MPRRHGAHSNALHALILAHQPGEILMSREVAAVAGLYRNNTHSLCLLFVRWGYLRHVARGQWAIVALHPPRAVQKPTQPSQRTYDRRKAAGLCVGCGAPHATGRVLCPACAAIQSEQPSALLKATARLELARLRALPEPAPDGPDPQHPARR